MPINKNKWRKHQASELAHSKSSKMIDPSGEIHKWARREFPYPLILEIGGGPYGILREKHVEMIGIDPLMHKFVNKKWTIGIAGIGECLPFRDNIFDHIYCMDIVDHAYNEIKIINEIIRVLKIFGKLYFYSNCNKNDAYHHRIDYKALLEIFNNKFIFSTIKYMKCKVRKTESLIGIGIKG